MNYDEDFAQVLRLELKRAEEQLEKYKDTPMRIYWLGVVDTTVLIMGYLGIQLRDIENE